MKSISPTTEGFRAAFQRPAFTFAEIAWRWALGATATALLFFYGVEFIDTLPVTNGDALLLATRQPFLVARAVAHILHGSLTRAALAALVAILALCVLWIIAASFGRLATTRALLEHFRSRADVWGIQDSSAKTESEEEVSTTRPRPLRALIDLNFLRVAALLAAVLALAGASFLSNLVSTEKNPQPDLAVVLFFLLLAVIITAGWLLNWWLSFAAIFAVRDGEDALGALSGAAGLASARPGAVLAVSIWSGLAHLVALSVGSSAAFFLFALIGFAPRLVLAALVLLGLVYFAVVDWLYIARLAGYICIVEMPEALYAAPLPPPITPVNMRKDLEGVIDRDEPILSDIPNLALGN